MDPWRRVKDVLEAVPGVRMAFAFGSRVVGNPTDESDLDIAVYFASRERPFDMEVGGFFDGEDGLWADLEKTARLSVDLVVLNRAPATLADAILRTGIPLVVKDPSLHRGFQLAVAREAEDYRAFAEDFWRIKLRSRSLTPIDRDRLIRIVDFLESEMGSYPQLAGLSADGYRGEPSVRRDAERFVENVVNSSIDIAKIVLAAEARPIPQTYGEALSALGTLPGFDAAAAERLSAHTRLRNVLAHQYLDMKFDRIRAFLSASAPDYRALVDWTKARYLA